MSLQLNNEVENIKQVDWQEWFVAGRTKRHITQRRTELVLTQADIRQGMRVLDVGCSFGHTSLLAAKKGAGVFGVDINHSLLEVGVKLGEANGIKVNFLRANAKRLPFTDKTFDVVICSELIEHVIDWQNVLKEITRVIKKGGRAVISTPNIEGLARLKELLIKYHLLYIGGYERFISPEEIRRELKGIGFEIERETRANMAFSYLPDCFYHVTLWLEKVTRPLEERWGGTIVFTCRKTASDPSAGLPKSENLDRVLACPICLGGLRMGGKDITCLNCAKKYSVNKDIPIMLADKDEARD
jgi:2-polyprenyl-6-hydroxyphenyl methylase/3-demethylubiquinone-9 3-methyltransferase